MWSMPCLVSSHGREIATHLWCMLADPNSRAVQVLERDSCIAQLRDELACSRQAHAADTARLNAQSSLADERADQLEQIQKQRTQEKVRSMVSLLTRPLACCEVQTMTRTDQQHIQQSQTPIKEITTGHPLQSTLHCSEYPALFSAAAMLALLSALLQHRGLQFQVHATAGAHQHTTAGGGGRAESRAAGGQ